MKGLYIILFFSLLVLPRTKCLGTSKFPGDSIAKSSTKSTGKIEKKGDNSGKNPSVENKESIIAKVDTLINKQISSFKLEVQRNIRDSLANKPSKTDLQNSTVAKSTKIIIGIVLVLLIAAVIFSFKRIIELYDSIEDPHGGIKEIKAKLDSLEKLYENLTPDEDPQGRQKKKQMGSGGKTMSIQQLETTVYEQTDAIKALEGQVRQLFELSRTRESGKGSFGYNAKTDMTIKESKTETVFGVFYMSTPNRDGSFSSTSMSSTFKPTASMYVFTIKNKDGDEAEFGLINDKDTINDAVRSPDSYLLPVCDINGVLPHQAQSVETKTKGSVRKDGDIWKLVSKAVVEFS
jgi:hypothetical protein